MRKGKRKRITTREEALCEANGVKCDANGVKAVTGFLSLLNGGLVGVATGEMDEWLNSILLDWATDRAAEIEEQAEALEKFLEPTSVTAGPTEPLHVVVREGGA